MLPSSPPLWPDMRPPQLGPNLGDHTPGSALALHFCTTNPAGGARSGARMRSRQVKAISESLRAHPQTPPVACADYTAVPHCYHTVRIRLHSGGMIVRCSPALQTGGMLSAAVGGRRAAPRRRSTTHGGRLPPLHDGRPQNGDTMADGGPQKTVTRWQDGGRR